MNLFFNTNLTKSYHSGSQKARVLTEDWVKRNSFCPCCGNISLKDFENNRPVADFYCENCNEEFELKSKNGLFSNIITDGAYSTMIERINSNQNPNFFFLTYSKDFCVNNFLLIPNHFFTPNIIQKRKPLSENARRAGWIGCNVDISDVPESGKIFIIKNQKEVDKQIVISNYKRTISIKTTNIESRSWLLDVLNCIEKINTKNFSLNQVYQFERELQIKHPENNFVKDKIRQQLQNLRDKGFIEFTTRGNYKKI
ncbi:MAG: Type-2 restriction enzyme DpnI [candidate division CPR1 bacterium ADurb.Bin160]|uniref:Type-2 restriction enzyme DpnI n=1 Tax=candidate division CPR1 bacterium ADurb.Bin160 TaxID=1852826 RepID=A0A1V5ZHW7_9BACT|nr:MAG: Type-2 restriction enzyme DpnI [candidate division CPR1 bacterium ADurb.Bin160]